eukprot:UN17111
MSCFLIIFHSATPKTFPATYSRLKVILRLRGPKYFCDIRPPQIFPGACGARNFSCGDFPKNWPYFFHCCKTLVSVLRSTSIQSQVCKLR